jgi:hypothetical protein
MFDTEDRTTGLLPQSEWHELPLCITYLAARLVRARSGGRVPGLRIGVPGVLSAMRSEGDLGLLALRVQGH